MLKETKSEQIVFFLFFFVEKINGIIKKNFNLVSVQ